MSTVLPVDRDALRTLLKENLVDTSNLSSCINISQKQIWAAGKKYVPIYTSSKGWRLYWLGRLSENDFLSIQDELQQNMKTTADIAKMLNVTSFLINRAKWEQKITPIYVATKGDYYWLPDIEQSDFFKRRNKK